MQQCNVTACLVINKMIAVNSFYRLQERYLQSNMVSKVSVYDGRNIDCHASCFLCPSRSNNNNNNPKKKGMETIVWSPSYLGNL